MKTQPMLPPTAVDQHRQPVPDPSPAIATSGLRVRTELKAGLHLEFGRFMHQLNRLMRGKA